MPQPPPAGPGAQLLSLPLLLTPAKSEAARGCSASAPQWGQRVGWSRSSAARNSSKRWPQLRQVYSYMGMVDSGSRPGRIDPAPA